MESVIDREKRLKKTALDLYKRCKDDKLTLNEFERVLELTKIEAGTEIRI